LHKLSLKSKIVEIDLEIIKASEWKSLVELSHINGPKTSTGITFSLKLILP
jgi:hypothetical protein